MPNSSRDDCHLCHIHDHNHPSSLLRTSTLRDNSPPASRPRRHSRSSSIEKPHYHRSSSSSSNNHHHHHHHGSDHHINSSHHRDHDRHHNRGSGNRVPSALARLSEHSSHSLPASRSNTLNLYPEQVSVLPDGGHRYIGGDRISVRSLELTSPRHASDNRSHHSLHQTSSLQKSSIHSNPDIMTNSLPQLRSHGSHLSLNHQPSLSSPQDRTSEFFMPVSRLPYKDDSRKHRFNLQTVMLIGCYTLLFVMAVIIGVVLCHQNGWLGFGSPETLTSADSGDSNNALGSVRDNLADGNRLDSLGNLDGGGSRLNRLKDGTNSNIPVHNVVQIRENELAQLNVAGVLNSSPEIGRPRSISGSGRVNNIPGNRPIQTIHNLATSSNQENNNLNNNNQNNPNIEFHNNLPGKVFIGTSHIKQPVHNPPIRNVGVPSPVLINPSPDVPVPSLIPSHLGILEQHDQQQNVRFITQNSNNNNKQINSFSSSVGQNSHLNNPANIQIPPHQGQHSSNPNSNHPKLIENNSPFHPDGSLTSSTVIIGQSPFQHNQPPQFIGNPNNNQFINSGNHRVLPAPSRNQFPNNQPVNVRVPNNGRIILGPPQVTFVQNSQPQPNLEHVPRQTSSAAILPLVQEQQIFTPQFPPPLNGNKKKKGIIHTQSGIGPEFTFVSNSGNKNDQIIHKHIKFIPQFPPIHSSSQSKPSNQQQQLSFKPPITFSENSNNLNIPTIIREHSSSRPQFKPAKNSSNQKNQNKKDNAQVNQIHMEKMKMLKEILDAEGSGKLLQDLIALKNNRNSLTALSQQLSDKTGKHGPSPSIHSPAPQRNLASPAVLQHRESFNSSASIFVNRNENPSGNLQRNPNDGNRPSSTSNQRNPSQQSNGNSSKKRNNIQVVRELLASLISSPEVQEILSSRNRQAAAKGQATGRGLGSGNSGRPSLRGEEMRALLLKALSKEIPSGQTVQRLRVHGPQPSVTRQSVPQVQKTQRAKEKVVPIRGKITRAQQLGHFNTTIPSRVGGSRRTLQMRSFSNRMGVAESKQSAPSTEHRSASSPKVSSEHRSVRHPISTEHQSVKPPAASTEHESIRPPVRAKVPTEKQNARSLKSRVNGRTSRGRTTTPSPHFRLKVRTSGRSSARNSRTKDDKIITESVDMQSGKEGETDGEVVRHWRHMDQDGTMSQGTVRRDGSFAFTNCRPAEMCKKTME